MPDQGSNGRYPDGTPHQLGRYRLVRPVSTGGMARVFEGRRESLAGVAPRVAVKVILPQHAHDENFRDLFVNEARIGSLLSHQNVVQIQDFDCEQGVYYLVMEFVEGITVRKSIDVCRRHGRSIPIAVIAEVGRQVCDGLAYAHSITDAEGRALFLVHRDIKPSNLIAGPQGVVKILDFGISKALISREKSGAVRGTWGFMAPEQAEGQEVGGAADIYALAAVLYEMSTLRPLFPEKDPATVRGLMVKDEAARRASQLGGAHRDLAAILVRALQRDPAARYGSAKAMAKALGALGTDPVTAREHLLHFQQTIRQLSETGTVEGPGSPKLPVDAEARGGGLGIAVGNRSRVHQPGASMPVRRVVTRRRRRLTPEARRILLVGGLVLLGALIVWGWNWWNSDSDPSSTAAPSVGEVESAEDRVEAEGSEGTLPSPEPGTESPDGESRPDAVANEDQEPDPKPRSTDDSRRHSGTTGSVDASREETPPASDLVVPEADAAPDGPETSGPTVGNYGTVTIYGGSGDTIWMNGKKLRKSPLRGYPLSPGTHEFTLETSAGVQYTTQVTLSAGDERILKWNSVTGEVQRIER